MARYCAVIHALKAHGFRDITICIQKPDYEVKEEVLDCDYSRVSPSMFYG